jgi:hypothetical protein
MDILENPKLLTCIVTKGKAVSLQKELIERWQLHSANIHNARGVGRNVPLSKRGVGEQSEKEVLEVIIAGSIADEVFEFAYHHLDLANSPAGMIYLSEQPKSTLFRMPEIPSDA